MKLCVWLGGATTVQASHMSHGGSGSANQKKEVGGNAKVQLLGNAHI